MYFFIFASSEQLKIAAYPLAVIDLWIKQSVPSWNKPEYCLNSYFKRKNIRGQIFTRINSLELFVLLNLENNEKLFKFEKKLRMNKYEAFEPYFFKN